jgi:hypothetical protein
VKEVELVLPHELPTVKPTAIFDPLLEVKPLKKDD